MLLAVLSDTHGLFRPELPSRLAGVDHNLHAGDVGDPAILEALERIAPITAIRGNIDRYGPCAALPTTAAVEFGGCLLYMLHDLKDLDLHPRAAGIDVVVSGHTHVPSLSHQDSVLYLNPGSVGPRRFQLPIGYALLRIEAGIATAELLTLDAPRH
jgi:putative phosphoesterase